MKFPNTKHIVKELMFIVVNGVIHENAGSDLVKECKIHRTCEYGEAIITGGYRLPAKCKKTKVVND